MSNDTYPVVYLYVNTKDKGKELKASLRSLHNIKNFNGQVYVIGDKEDWFKDIIHIPKNRVHGKPFLDQIQKMKLACDIEDIPDTFIAMMDDVYITEPVEARVYIKGDMDYAKATPHQRNKKFTAEVLRDVFGIEKPRDYETHAPMLIDKAKLRLALNTLLSYPRNREILQWRSMYGNLFEVEAELFEDKKTKTKELKDGQIISTQYFVDALDLLFPEPSQYEVTT